MLFSARALTAFCALAFGFASIPSIAAEAQLSEIDRLEALNRTQPDETRAWAIASLQLSHSGVSGEQRVVALKRLRTTKAQLAAQLLAYRSQPMRSEWLNTTWGNALALSRDSDARELFRRVLADQYDPDFTFRSDAERQAFTPLFLFEKARINEDNASWLKGILARIGWFDISRYGKPASMAAWLLVQHADFDAAWQASIVEMLRAKVRSGDMQPDYFAYLTDRVALNQGRPQEFGTQGRCQEDGRWAPINLADSVGVNDRRESVGLGTLEAYAARFHCTREASH